MSKSASNEHIRNLNPAKQALKVCLIFSVLSALWIVSTDLYHYISTGDEFSNFLFSVIKGLIYVIISGTVFYFILRKFFTRFSYAITELSLSEEKFRTLADNIDIGITRRDTEGKGLFVNRASLVTSGKIAGVKGADSVLGKTFRETYGDTPVTEVLLSMLDETIKTKKPASRELIYRDYHLEGRFIPEFDEKGNVTSVITIVTDRTLEKLQLEKLRESELFNKTLLNSLPALVYIFEPAAIRNIYTNDSIFEILGYTPGSLHVQGSRLLEEITHPDDLSNFMEAVLPKIRSLRDDETFENTFRLMDSAGRWHWFKSHETVYKRMPSGEVLYTLGTAFDITELKGIEEELKEKTDYLNNVIESSPLAVADLDREGNVVSIWNSAAERIFGWKKEEVIGKRLPFVQEEMLGEFKSIRDEAFTKGRLVDKVVNRKKRSGEDVTICMNTFPAAMEHGKITRILSYYEDVTLRNKYEEEVNRNNRYLKLLYEAGLYAAGTFDMNDIYRNISGLIAEIVDAGSIVISSLNEDAAMLKCSYSTIEGKQVDVAFLPELKMDARSAKFQSQAIRTGKSIIINNYSRRLTELNDMTFFDEKGPITQPDDMAAMMPNSAIIIPLKYKNKISGALQVFSYKDTPYTMKDLRKLEPVAVLIASAAERARLFENAQKEIRERKLAYDEIRKLTKGIEQSPNSIVITDSNGDIEYVNPFFTELTGYTLEDVIGRNPRILQSGETMPETYENMWKTIAEGGVWQGEFRNRKKNGEFYWESVSIGPITDEGGKITHYIAIKQDITDNKNNDIRLKESLQEKETMLKEIHHRVKNNLQIISSLLNMQADRYRNPEAIEAINTSRNRVKAMAIVHENLYRSSDLAKTKMDSYINSLIANIYSVYGVSTERIAFSCSTSGIVFGLDTIIPLGLIINEAISNSLKHAFPDGRGGEIQVELSENSGSNFLLRIKDDGIGVPKGFRTETADSLGMILITGLASQLEGSAKLENKNGTELKIRFKEVKYRSRI